MYSNYCRWANLLIHSKKSLPLRRLQKLLQGPTQTCLQPASSRTVLKRSGAPNIQQARALLQPTRHPIWQCPWTILQPGAFITGDRVVHCAGHSSRAIIQSPATSYSPPYLLTMLQLWPTVLQHPLLLTAPWLLPTALQSQFLPIMLQSQPPQLRHPTTYLTLTEPLSPCSITRQLRSLPTTLPLIQSHRTRLQVSVL